MRLLALLLVICSALHADVLADLKTTLTNLSGHEPVKARVAYEFSAQNTEDDKPVVEEANVTALVQDGTEGLTILWPRELIDAAAKESRATEETPKKKPALRRAMDALNATTLNDYLNTTSQLQQLLEKAELLSNKTELWEGRPAQLLTFKITQKLPKYVKVLEQTVRLWLGADGTPLAAESRVLVKGRALLVISFESTESEDWRFARVGQRLVVARHVKESAGSGGGEKGMRKTVASLDIVDR
jgi:hypothetical protein